jgi:hypothetical protein
MPSELAVVAIGDAGHAGLPLSLAVVDAGIAWIRDQVEARRP